MTAVLDLYSNLVTTLLVITPRIISTSVIVSRTSMLELGLSKVLS